jgi:hypothetical protein
MLNTSPKPHTEMKLGKRSKRSPSERRDASAKGGEPSA